PHPGAPMGGRGGVPRDRASAHAYRARVGRAAAVTRCPRRRYAAVARGRSRTPGAVGRETDPFGANCGLPASTIAIWPEWMRGACRALAPGATAPVRPHDLADPDGSAGRLRATVAAARTRRLLRLCGALLACR